MVLMMVILWDHCFENNLDLLMVECMVLMKESNWGYLMVKILALYL